MDRRWFKYHSSQSVLPRRWRMSLRRSSVFFISFFNPSQVVCYTPRQLEEVDGPLCPAPGSILFFSAHRRRVNRTPHRILPTFRRHFVNVPRMSTASSGQEWSAGIHQWLMDERKRDSLVSILYPAWICSCAILTVITITRCLPRRYITSNIKLIRTVGCPSLIYSRQKEEVDRWILSNINERTMKVRNKRENHWCNMSFN